MYLLWREKILQPFLQSTGISEDEQKNVESAIGEVLTVKLLDVLVKTLSATQQQEIEQKVQAARTVDEKEQVIKELIEGDDVRKEEVQRFVQEEMPKILEEIVGAYLAHATPAQKETFFRLAKAAASSS